MPVKLNFLTIDTVPNCSGAHPFKNGTPIRNGYQAITDDGPFSQLTIASTIKPLQLLQPIQLKRYIRLLIL
jgi:hypothetical protein